MAKITDILGQEQEVDCIACEIQSGKIKLPIERIGETKNFVVEQDFEWPIEGFLIIASKRHIYSILEFNEEEKKEFFYVLERSRKVQKKVLDIDKVTTIQEEDSSSSHFHVWLFPWHNWMKDKGLENIKELMEYAKENFSKKEHLEKIEKESKELRKNF